MAQTIGKELLIERTGFGLDFLKETACFQFFPPGADHRTAAEQSKLVSNQVLVQAAVSAVSQDNQIPQSLLRVLQ